MLSEKRHSEIMIVYHLFLHSKHRGYSPIAFLRSLSSSPCLQCTHPQLRDAGVSEHLGSDRGVGVDVLTPSLEMPESVNILVLTVGLG
jgi:hypothetical protein